MAREERRRPARLPWTEEETETLLRLWPNSTPAEIARKVRRTEAAVTVKATRMGLPERDRPSRHANTERRCLMCRRLFNSTGPDNHVCPGCKTSDDWTDGDNSYPFYFLT